MNTIIEALQNVIGDIRVSHSDRWLVWDDGFWVVYERKPYAKRTTVIVETTLEEQAVQALIEGDDYNELD